MSKYWLVTVHSVYGADLFAFDTYEEAKAFADEKYHEDVVYGTQIRPEYE